MEDGKWINLFTRGREAVPISSLASGSSGHKRLRDFADAESRGKSDVVLSLARQVRIEYRHARIPKRAFGLLNSVFAEYKALVDARVGPLMAAYADRQPRCNWTAAEHEADEFDAAMPLSKRIRTLREDGVEYDEVAASHWVSRKHERAAGSFIA